MCYFKNIAKQFSKLIQYAVLVALCLLLISSSNTHFYNQDRESVVSVENAYEEVNLIIDEYTNYSNSQRININAEATETVSYCLKEIFLSVREILFCHSKLYVKYCQWLI